MTVAEIMQQIERKMSTSIDVLHRELGAIRTGRASAAIIEHVRVDYAGTPTPIHHLANISVPDARQILIQPWDRTMVGHVEKALMKSDLGLTPSSDGQVIRLIIPPLSQERRLDLTKMVHKRVEEDKVAIRNLRRDALEQIKKLEKDKELSQDESKRSQDQLQKVTDAYTARAEKLGKDKEQELLSG
ncbi:ribosome recycling factor [Dehalogenimonas formicexedens]|uniref:Ribosome-recycling factor n=1 Tax=Dehalogenimonas formicexedens TaxID=1839801 RepID=A0A1P8F844_9CHLR|nr:ribosome recycling factor [Dehalogenimonas formicexedens]APV44603.1 ribosome recycling factor [Dehalogenimonas formicexedens]